MSDLAVRLGYTRDAVLVIAHVDDIGMHRDETDGSLEVLAHVQGLSAPPRRGKGVFLEDSGVVCLPGVENVVLFCGRSELGTIE